LDPIYLQKAVVYSFGDALKFVQAMDALLFKDGLTQEHVVKLDVDKLVSPKSFGWRFLAFDLRMPNEQIVECYIVFTGLEHAKKHAPWLLNPARHLGKQQRCWNMSNHEIFEKWRVRDISRLTPEEEKEYKADCAESMSRYSRAWLGTLRRTPEDILHQFWTPFGYRYRDGELRNIGYRLKPVGIAAIAFKTQGPLPLPECTQETAS
jgi:hypothetical protein